MLGSDIELKWNRRDAESLRFVIDKYCKRRRQAIQAGGCLGVFANEMAERGFDHVYTFEPDPELFQKLNRNVKYHNVVRMQAALGNGGAPVKTVCELRPNDGKTSLHEGMTRTEADPEGFVPVLRIDDLHLTAVDLVYLDVEGDELAALQGGYQTIMRCRPVIACEINRGITYRGFTKEDVRTYIEAMLGYKRVDVLRSDEVFIPV